ncbi:hypothetical protein [Rhodopseudomonas sp. BR0M22]|uniref:hypothetical protein n=1 Tax=Rhodopseudomonas sp. BR0M22 TaxID=2269369 RepID=UPI0013DF60B6|nr:hypothetical protein [Rhodopseudomonas sp. BR0M22]
MSDSINLLLNFISTASVAALAGLLSYAVGKGMKRYELELNIRREGVSMKQRLYAEFLAEANRQTLQSIDVKNVKADSFSVITCKLAEIELVSSPEVVDAAKEICSYVIDAHGKESDPRGNFFDLTQVFIQNARRELASEGKLLSRA